MTVGRSGSTALMNYLQKFDDIALPCRDIACVDNELLHPSFVAQYQADYAALLGTAIDSGDALTDAFFNMHKKSKYVGFKSMPNRHSNIVQFLSKPDVQIIALWRDDVASTVASFMKAQDTGSWRRDGGRHRCAGTSRAGATQAGEADSARRARRLAPVVRRSPSPRHDERLPFPRPPRASALGPAPGARPFP